MPYQALTDSDLMSLQQAWHYTARWGDGSERRATDTHKSECGCSTLREKRSAEPRQNKLKCKLIAVGALVVDRWFGVSTPIES